MEPTQSAVRLMLPISASKSADGVHTSPFAAVRHGMGVSCRGAGSAMMGLATGGRGGSTVTTGIVAETGEQALSPIKSSRRARGRMVGFLGSGGDGCLFL